MFVVVDRRGCDLPEVYGPFNSREAADRYARRIFDIDGYTHEEIELPDGVDICLLQHPLGR